MDGSIQRPGYMASFCRRFIVASRRLLETILKRERIQGIVLKVDLVAAVKYRSALLRKAREPATLGTTYVHGMDTGASGGRALCWFPV